MSAEKFEIDPELNELNGKFFVVESEGGKCRVAFLEKHYFEKEQTRDVLVLQSFEDFRNRYMNQLVQVGVAENGKPIMEPKGKYWLKHPLRRQFTHLMSLPGRPDMIFPSASIVVFIDGDFWHGWDFEKRKERLSSYWKEKIERNMKRDKKNFRKLKAEGWTVIRLWEHEVKKDVEGCVDRIVQALEKAKKNPKNINLVQRKKTVSR